MQHRCSTCGPPLPAPADKEPSTANASALTELGVVIEAVGRRHARRKVLHDLPALPRAVRRVQHHGLRGLAALVVARRVFVVDGRPPCARKTLINARLADRGGWGAVYLPSRAGRRPSCERFDGKTTGRQGARPGGPWTALAAALALPPGSWGRRASGPTGPRHRALCTQQRTFVAAGWVSGVRGWRLGGRGGVSATRHKPAIP